MNNRNPDIRVQYSYPIVRAWLIGLVLPNAQTKVKTRWRALLYWTWHTLVSAFSNTRKVYLTPPRNEKLSLDNVEFRFGIDSFLPTTRNEKLSWTTWTSDLVRTAYCCEAVLNPIPGMPRLSLFRHLIGGTQFLVLNVIS